jgi:ubiquinone/menaquinone biosynthesis C-methylase UbiE
MKKDRKRVCPLEKAKKLDSFFRRLIHNPKKIFGKYVKEDMTVLDIGCGPGLFAIELANIVKDGKVIAADLQQGMLDILKKKIAGKEIEKTIELHKCDDDKIGISEKVDLVVAFYVVHELPSLENFLGEMKQIMKKDSYMVIAEPKTHVTKKEFEAYIEKAESLGFEFVEKPLILFSRAVVLKNG